MARFRRDEMWMERSCVLFYHGFVWFNMVLLWFCMVLLWFYHGLLWFIEWFNDGMICWDNDGIILGY